MVDDTYGFDDNTDLYDPNMDVSIDETDKFYYEDIEREDALTKARTWFKVPFDKSSGNELADRPEIEDIPVKMVEIEIDHNLVPNNTITFDLTGSNSESFGIRINVSDVLFIAALFLLS